MEERLVMEPRADHDEIRRALARFNNGRGDLPSDPQVLDALRRVYLRLQKVWKKQGGFLGVDLSPFVRKLIERLNPEWANA